MGFVETITSDWAILLIPVISAAVGWGTNVVAVKMMFVPTEFIGIKPYLGWQGIVPASARVLARRSTDLITNQLLTLPQLFASFDAKKMADKLDGPLDQLTDQILSEVAETHAAETWSKLAEPAQQAVRTMLRAEVKLTATGILEDFHENIEDIIDLKEVVMSTVERDKSLISDLFEEVGQKEFEFIRISGAYFGFLFGLIQMAAWVYWPLWWILPFAGFFVGYATNWLAIKLIFEPAKPYRVGPWIVQGMFHKRQHEVAELFGTNIATRVMNPDNIVRTITEGSQAGTLKGIIRKRMDALLEKYAGNPMTAMLFPPEKLDALRSDLHARMDVELPKPGGFLHGFADGAMDIQGELQSRMKALDATNFEGVLRPAFQQDEWKLIVVGAALGLGAGFIQLVTLFGEALANR